MATTNFWKLMEETEALMKANDQLELEKKYRIKVNVIPKNVVEETDKAPFFIHSEIQWLYEYHYTIPSEYLDKIKALPRKTMLQDLNKVVYDAIARYHVFSEKEFEPEQIWFLLHAFYLLRDLKATESLEVILDFLSQDDELIEFWMGKLKFTSWTVIAMCGFKNLERLKSFMKEPGRSEYSRKDIGKAVLHLSLFSIIERQTAVDWYKDVFTYFIENKSTDNLIDSEMNGSLVLNCMGLRAKELWKEIKKLYYEGWVSTYVSGDMDRIIQGLYNEIPFDPQTLAIKTIHENYQQLVTGVELKDIKPDNKNVIIDGAVPDDFEWDNYYNGEPFIRPEPKVGRNDPCTCGSGKKYKKCCGK